MFWCLEAVNPKQLPLSHWNHTTTMLAPDGVCRLTTRVDSPSRMDHPTCLAIVQTPACLVFRDTCYSPRTHRDQLDYSAATTVNENFDPPDSS